VPPESSLGPARLRRVAARSNPTADWETRRADPRVGRGAGPRRPAKPTARGRVQRLPTDWKGRIVRSRSSRLTQQTAAIAPPRSM